MAREQQDAPGAWYAVTLLAGVYAVNIADRYVMSQLLEPIKHDLHLSDAAVGFLTGVPLALFYLFANIPIAMLADRTHRVRLISVALTLWSLFTALCGLTRTFWQFAATRVLVGVGEAGGTPPSAALISDFIGWRRRALALSVFSVGASIGSMIGASAGYAADRWGWRTAVMLLGIPGVLMAALLLATVREPPRGRFDVAPPAKQATLAEMLAYCAASPAIRHMLAASFLYCLWAWGLLWWTPAFLARSLHLSGTESGRALALIHGIGGTAVLLATAVLMRKVQGRDARWPPRFIALVCLIGSPISFIAYSSHSATVTLAALWVFVPMSYAVFGPPYAMTQNLLPASMRAQGMAMLQITSNLANLVVAPLLIGWVADLLQPQYGAESLRVVLIPVTFVGAWAGVHWWMGARHYRAGIAQAGNAVSSEM